MFPFIWLLTMSLRPVDDIFAWPPKLLFVPTLDNYIELWDTAISPNLRQQPLASSAPP